MLPSRLKYRNDVVPLVDISVDAIQKIVHIHCEMWYIVTLLSLCVVRLQRRDLYSWLMSQVLDILWLRVIT